MQLEYFQLIDRITDLNFGRENHHGRGAGSAAKHHLRRAFPGLSAACPGVLLIESMAQTSGWLLIALMKFERMPFLAAVKEAKMRGFVTPGELLTVEASLVHEGSGYAITAGQSQRRRQAEVQRDAHLQPYALSRMPDLRGHMEAMAKRIGFPQQVDLLMAETNRLQLRGRWKPGSPASALPPRSAKALTRIGTR